MGSFFKFGEVVPEILAFYLVLQKRDCFRQNLEELTWHHKQDS